MNGDLADDLAVRQLVSVGTAGPLAVESLLLLVASVPPSAPADYLPHRGVVVAPPNIESEDLSRLLRLGIRILVVEHLVELL